MPRRVSHQTACALRLFGLAGLAAAALVLGSCNSGMDAIDERIAGMMQNRAAAIDANKVPNLDLQNQQRENDDPTVRQQSLSTKPPTNNPEASALKYKMAGEAREVSQRLNSYATEAYGENTSGKGLQDPLVLNLASSWRTTQQSSRDYLTAEEDYMLAVIRLLAEQHRWEPRFFNDTTLGVGSQWNDGSNAPALNAINTLKVQQKLPYGGQVEAAWVTQLSQQLRQAVSGGYTQSSDMEFAVTIPLLRGAGEVAREPLIQAERNLVYQSRTFERFRRQLLVGIANDYFQLVQTQSAISNQERSLESLKLFQQATQARVDAGRIRAFEVNIASNDVLNAEAGLANLREQYILQLDRFKVRLGLDPSTRVVIRPLALELPSPDETLDQATVAALEYRLDLQNARDRVDDSRRGVANAKNELLPGLNLAASSTLPSNPDNDVSQFAFSPLDANLQGSATLSLPLDKDIERLNLRSATINLQQSERSFQQLRDNIVVSVRSALRNIDLASFRLKLAEQQVEINKRRLEEQLLKIDEVDAKQVVDSQNALLDAENRRDQALTDLRNSILNYLLESDQLRVAPDGTFQPLPGMSIPAGEKPRLPGEGDPLPMPTPAQLNQMDEGH